MRFAKSLPREQVVFAAVATIAPVLLCAFMFGLDIPLASAKFWSMPKGDMAAMTVAYEAYVRQPWTFPITMVSGLTPEPVSIVFSDSIPWLAVLLKASGLGPWFNPLGLFLLLSYPLQTWSMIALLRSLGVKDRIPLLIGGLLALLFPSWIARQFGHIALCGHWLLLFSLALSVSSARLGLTWRRVGWFAALAGLATGIHAYHLVPVGAAFGAALLSELAQRRSGAWTRVPVAAVAVLAAVIVPAWLLGYDQGSKASGGAAALGYYAMNVLGPVWPQASKVFGQDWNGTWFLKHMDPTGGQTFEGYQFIGVGALLLTAIMLGLAVRGLASGRRPEVGAWARWTPLALAMVGLTLWAIGWNVYVHKVLVLEVPKPSGRLAEYLAVYRAHGRFFWAPGYLLLALGIRWVSRLPPRVGLPLLGVALAVQAYDTSEMRKGVRSVWVAPEPSEIPAALVASPAIRGRPWVFRPTYFCTTSFGDLRALGQMVLLAERTGGATNTFGTARNNDAACDIVPTDMTMDAAPDDRRITVVLSNGRTVGGFLEPVAQRGDCYRFNRGVVCGRDLAGIKGLQRVPPGEMTANRTAVSSLRLDQPPKSSALVSGWADPDPGGKAIWTIGPKALFVLNAPSDIGPQGFYLDIVALGFSDQPLRPQRVTLYAEGRRLETKAIEAGDFTTYRFKVPAGAVAPGRPARFMLDLPDARVSKIDPRQLGIGVQAITIVR